MALALWTLGQIVGIALVIAAVIATRVVIDALHDFHTAGLARIRAAALNDRSTTS